MKPDERTTILVVGGREFLTQESRAFTSRGLRLDHCDLSTVTAKSAPKVFAGAKAILVAETPGKYRQLAEVFDRIAALATNEGLAVGYLPCDGDASKRASALLDDAPAYRPSENRKIWIYVQNQVDELAEVLRRHDPGPHSGQAKVTTLGEDFVMPEAHRRLLLRAFSDASNVAIEKLSGGASAQGAYRVYASLSTRFGRRDPSPFVFKVDSPDKIYQECLNYQESVEPLVPFHLRPGLIDDRCVVTPEWAALACNFVEGAAPLETVLSNGQGAGVIFSLFETTLRGFRYHALSSRPERDVLRAFVIDRVKISQLRDDPRKSPRIAKAQEFGLSREPEDLERDIAEAAGQLKVLHGVYHGDLHMGNVMVRHRDAIVIDFGSLRPEGPLTADPAALEASIAFGTRKEELSTLQPEWKDFIDRVYLDPIKLPIPIPEHFHFSWVNRAIREIRHIVHCCGVKRKEALLVLAASLLRYGRFSAPLFRDAALIAVSEERKAYAMVKAEQLFMKATKA